MSLPGFRPIFTIGHSLHTADVFCRLLLRHEIEIVLDVRSSPYSRRAPHFNRSSLQSLLRDVGIRYSFGGRTLGGRPQDDRLYQYGQASYDLMAATESFLASLRRVARGAKSSLVALLCAEADPIECHRFLLVGRALHARGLDVQHILPNGVAEPHADGEYRMLVATELAQADAFSDNTDALALAYQRQAARFAFVKPSQPYPFRQLETA
jgi:uncharacterized protein (DUF488 family)